MSNWNIWTTAMHFIGLFPKKEYMIWYKNKILIVNALVHQFYTILYSQQKPHFWWRSIFAKKLGPFQNWTQNFLEPKTDWQCWLFLWFQLDSKKNISHQNIVQQNGNQQRTKVTITTKSEAVSRTSSALIFRSFSRLRLATKSSACDGKEILAMD